MSKLLLHAEQPKHIYNKVVRQTKEVSFNESLYDLEDVAQISFYSVSTMQKKAKVKKMESDSYIFLEENVILT